MSSQNRINAGAEYLLYRIWATLQTAQGIHVESLLTCVGGLAGYACRRYAKQTGSNDALIDSPMSIWSLVSRAVVKLGEPPPDIQEIVRKVDSEQGAPQLPDWHRPGHPTFVYLKQLWPQTLPIAQRFCVRPIHLPVLYGIALQRAIEHTKDRLSPTLAASISMECAIAMSRVDLPEPAAELTATIAAPVVLPPVRATLPVKAKPPGPSQWWMTVKRVPPSVNVAALACLAFVTTAAAMYRGNAREQDVEPANTVLAMASANSEALAREEGNVSQLALDGEMQPAAGRPADDQQSATLAAQTLTASSTSPQYVRPPAQSALSEPSIDDDVPRPQPANFGADEGLMRDDSGQTIRMAADTDEY